MNPPAKRLLLVEDEPLIAMAEKRQLEKIGYSVHHVLTGEASVTYSLDTDSKPDLILMDIDLGKGIDGTQAAEQILDEIDIPVVFLSSHAEPDVVEKTERITSYGYVVKNSAIAVLDASIKMAFKLFEAKIQEQRNETALLHSRDLMKYIIEHNWGAVAVLDRERKFIYVSKQYLDQFNVTDRDIIGKHHYEVFPDLPQEFRDAHERALVGEISTGAGEPYERDDGTIMWGRWECRPWYEAEDSIGGFVVYTEVVSNELAEKIETRDSINYLRSILRTTHDGFWVVDMNGNFLDVNGTYCRMSGYTREELLQLSIPDIDADEQPQETEDWIEEIRSTGYALFQTRHRRKDGTVFEVEVSVSFLGSEHRDRLIAFCRDITERKRAEEALDRERKLLRTIIDRIPSVIYVKDIAGRKQIANRADYHYAGFEREEDVIGKDDFDIYPAAIAKPFVEDDQRVLKRGESVIDREEKIITQNGELVWQLTTKLPLYDRDGEITGLVGIGRNITGRKRAEEEIQHQLAEKETLLKEVHHRIKNNMAQVESLLSLQADSADNAEVKSALDEARTRVRSIRVLYEKLLIGTDYAEVSIKNYLESLIDSLVVVFKEHPDVTVETRVVDFALSSKTAIAVGIIVNELLTNVFKYAFEGRNEGHVAIELEKAGTRAILTIWDNGAGFDQRVIDNNAPGFGLTLVNMLAEQLDGTFVIENENGAKGTVTFGV